MLLQGVLREEVPPLAAAEHNVDLAVAVLKAVPVKAEKKEQTLKLNAKRKKLYYSWVTGTLRHGTLRHGKLSNGRLSNGRLRHRN